MRIERLSARLARVRPEAVYAQRRSRLEHLEASLTRVVRSRLDRFGPVETMRRLNWAIGAFTEEARARLDAIDRELTIASPISVLQRGYTVTTRADGSLLRKSDDTTPGETIRTRFAQSAIESTVVGADGAEPIPAPVPLPKRRKRGHRTDPAQHKLFPSDSGKVDP